MTRKFYVAGSNWTSEVELSNVEDFPPDSLQMEAATRAVEARYGKRSDVEYSSHKPIKLTNKQKATCQLHAALVQLLTDELIEGCGIGNLLCVMDAEKKDEDNEWYVSSRVVLENAGVPKLVAVFDEKYPSKKEETH